MFFCFRKMFSNTAYYNIFIVDLHSLQELFGTETSGEYRPGLKRPVGSKNTNARKQPVAPTPSSASTSSASTSTSTSTSSVEVTFKQPFTAQRAKNSKTFATCTDCSKPRVRLLSIPNLLLLTQYLTN